MFDEHGNLPAGTLRLTAQDTLDRFGTGSARREWLAGRLRDLLDFARASGLVRRVYLWGSFATAKPSPNDLDVLLVFQADLTDEELTVSTGRIAPVASWR